MGFIDWDALPLSRAAVGRDADRRTDPAVVHDALQDARTRVVLVHRSRLAVRAQDDVSADERELAFLEASEVDAALVEDAAPGARSQRALWLYLGRDAGPTGVAYVAVVLHDEGGAQLDIEGIAPTSPVTDLVESHEWASLRDIGSQLSVRDAGLATQSVGLAAWHASHPRCSRCGEPTEATTGGWVRQCTNDGSDHYPRTDPAVIMAVVDADDRLLLGHAAQWPQGRYSTLAGYVEPGESLENAVRREVLEESGLEIGAVEYRGSQPWPFPASLMMAFVARATTTDITVDGVEVTEAHWFSREGLDAAIADGSVLLPSSTSIARALIEDWYGAGLTGSWGATPAR
ncbi:NAD(+) diphosphatase [Sanguibacter antarcticus]|uniref:NAD(+) diphosphatase n=1 Tax=Sanguibacter antarcticus TaxID=372484 RepID=A0A2A9E483_9MICO|nr:NAD(+) diphosphatase [Sanguibacter antarcticus]PFG33857.1 NAD+ diphosphatase [Sanguibacter antarcticus]